MLLDALGSRGYATIAEPGRRIVAAETAGAGKKLPWVDIKAFAYSALDMARSDLTSADSLSGFVFFDRGLVDAAVGLQFAGGEPYHKTLGVKLHYSRTVFLAPPWPEIFTQDEARRHGFKSALAEFHRLEAALPDLGYDICTLPKTSIEDRADFVLDKLGSL
jgi:predicted ATPase